MIKRELKCHCKKIVIEVITPKKISNLIKCNCSLCSKKNAIMAITEPENFKIVEGEKFLKNISFIQIQLIIFSAQFVEYTLITIQGEIRNYLDLILCALKIKRD